VAAAAVAVVIMMPVTMMMGDPALQKRTYRTAALCSDVWQNRKRTSLRLLVKAYLLDMTGGFQSRVCVRTVCPGAVEVGDSQFWRRRRWRWW